MRRTMSNATGMSTGTTEDAEYDERPAKRQKIAEPTPRKSACQACRMRKVKCDRSRPSCYVCTASGTRCEYLDGSKESAMSLQQATTQILGRLDRLQSGLDHLTNATQSIRRANPTLYTQHSGHSLPLSDEIIKEIESSTVEQSRDFLRIPTSRTSSDNILCWEIFERQYPRNHLISPMFSGKGHFGKTHESSSERSFKPFGQFRPPQEESIPSLIEKFLLNVHTKNPVVNVADLIREGRKAAQRGIGWDAWSCLILIVCALGSVARPFARPTPATLLINANSSPYRTRERSHTSTQVFCKELEEGDSCFQLALRRLGALGHTVIGTQCYFLSGVYLMYTMRPLLSWQYFYHASILFHVHLKNIHGFDDDTGIADIPTSDLQRMDRKNRRLEQSLYWSLFKSECEFRVEIPFPQSEIASFHHPSLFPSPPTPGTPVEYDPSISPHSTAQNSIANQLASQSQSTHLPLDSTIVADPIPPVHQTEHRYREEESWYYYLTEIALRRIGNRIVNTFFRQDRTTWLDIKPLLRIAQELDVQVSAWSANLPPAMKHYEAQSTIKAPMLSAYTDDPHGYVSQELSWALENRILEVRSWLYQPFLYFLIHSNEVINKSASPIIQTRQIGDAEPVSNHLNGSMHQPYPTLSRSGTDSSSIIDSLDLEEQDILYEMIISGIECNLKILDARSLQHRHHGLWFDMRSLMGASLILLAIIKSGKLNWIPGGSELLLGTETVQATSNTHRVGGKIGHVLRQFEFWGGEAREFARHRDVLVEVVGQLKQMPVVASTA